MAPRLHVEIPGDIEVAVVHEAFAEPQSRASPRDAEWTATLLAVWGIDTEQIGQEIRNDFKK